jgi:diketogulonate reductase-like aldo/keto reductase
VCLETKKQRMTQLPTIGFGTYRVTDQSVIENAIRCGYNHFDTAELYKNEIIVKQAIESTATGKIYITTKISKKSIEAGQIENSFYERLSIFPYIDILLLHVPSNDCRKDWDQLCELYQKNRQRIGYIGVSNYDTHQMKQLEGSAIKPFCNQIELTPFYTRTELVNYLRNNDILVVSHTTLTRTEKFENINLQILSKKYNVSVASILLHWALTNNYIIIPKACSYDHMVENKSLPKFELDSGDIKLLDSLNENFYITKVIT